MVRREQFPSQFQRPANQIESLRILASIEKDYTEVVPSRGKEWVIGATCRLPDRDGAPEESFGIRIALRAVMNLAQAIEGDGAFAEGEGFFENGFRVSPFTATREDQSQVVQYARGQIRVRRG